MSTERLALWFVGPSELELRPDPPRALVAGEVRARGRVSGISRGTELLLYRGEGPEPFDPSIEPAGDTGAPTYPRRYGYAWIGEVAASASPRLSVGDRVLGLLPHGHAHEVAAGRLRRLPDAIPDARAALAPLVETAINCVWDARIALGERVAILGGGALGLLVAHLARLAGAEVRLVERVPSRRAIAHGLGIGDVRSSGEDATADHDVVVEATGYPVALDLAIRHAALEARVVIASFYGRRRSDVALGDAFHRRRLSLVSSQVSRIPAHMSARWDADRRWALVFDILADPRLDALVTREVPFGEAREHYAHLAAFPEEGLFSVLVYK